MDILRPETVLRAVLHKVRPAPALSLLLLLVPHPAGDSGSTVEEEEGRGATGQDKEPVQGGPVS